MTGTHAAPTVNQRPAAVRHLFDWLVTGQVMTVNPAHSVRAPSFRANAARPLRFPPEEARQLLDSIPADTLMGQRDRALIGLMTYTFARIGAAIGMRSGTSICRTGGCGCVCTRKAASSLSCRSP
ncbi:hypothetical protein QN219_30235 [Sinorhizobium sp. 7-81]|uniref:hypothetical protein n=1 Tax=Sinorhizobium sp. 8-89 TaxID=3049089 RepID=UPI0024C2BA6A|nr:hypothetical protein [Sinorhizobium sp. 8-89]MDK1494246.1 hypothetical protein [Sinorhizobium sp. 8-89]